MAETPHLHAAGQDREALAVKTLVTTHFAHEAFFRSLGIGYPMCWLASEVQLRDLVPDMVGETDLIGGPLHLLNEEVHQPHRGAISSDELRFLEWAAPDLAAQYLIERGRVLWPPNLDRVVAVEAKAFYAMGPDPAASEKDFKSTKKGKHEEVAKQIRRNQEVGFDAVTFIDIIATPAQIDDGSAAWFSAAVHAHDAIRHSGAITSSRLGSDDHSTGHWVFSLGAVSSKPEAHAGSATSKQLRPQGANPLLALPEVQQRRQELVRGLSRWLKDSKPATYPHVIFPAG